MARRRTSPTLIGAFVVGGLALLIATIIVAGGGRFFTRKEYAVMHFSGSIYGLQVGAPVVFRGVRLGSVTSIGLVYDKAADRFSIPVLAELEPHIIRGMGDRRSDEEAERGETLQALVKRGLRAQLSLQSLLTGQLYVDLDLRPEKPGQLRGGTYRSAIEIPTTPTAIQALRGQLEGLDLRKLLDDVSAIAGSARSVLAGPQLKQALDNVVQITEQVQQLSERLNRRIDPLADAATATLGDSRRAIERVTGVLDKAGGAADKVSGAADRVGRAAERAGTMLAPEAPLVRDVQRAAAELAATAAALRQHTADDSGLVQNADRTLQDLSRAARAVRELADMLERHPEALLRGRRRERDPEPEPDADADPVAEVAPAPPRSVPASPSAAAGR
jgi:paraquat-inducible protein B